MLDLFAGYGGAVSVNFGMSAGLRLLSVSFFSITLQNNAFVNCGVTARASGGNAYGGAVSLYIGAYSSFVSLNGDAVSAAGDTVVRNVSVTLDKARFESCSAIRETSVSDSFGGNVYGGSFSFYVGAHCWSRSAGIGGSRISSSTSGSVNASGMNVRVHKVISLHSRAFTTTSGDVAYGSNSYGGFMSILHVGSYCWSFSDSASGISNSRCGATSLRDVLVHVSGSSCSNCSAASENQHSL